MINSTVGIVVKAADGFSEEKVNRTIFSLKDSHTY